MLRSSNRKLTRLPNGAFALIQSITSGLRVGLLILLFSCSSHIHRTHSPTLITVRCSFSTIHCKSLSQTLLPCYPSACSSLSILTDSFPRLRVISVDGVYPAPVGASWFTKRRSSESALLIVVPLHIHSLAGACELEDPGPAGTGWVSLPTLPLQPSIEDLDPVRTVDCQPPLRRSPTFTARCPPLP